MYRPPIEIIFGEMERKFEGDILKAIQKYDVVIDKEGLLRALRYDRGQYEKGYADGKADAMNDLVHCRDCKFWADGVAGCTDHVKMCKIGFYMVGENGYCCFGERREGE